MRFRACLLTTCLLSVTAASADTSSQNLKKAIDTWDARALKVMANQTFETTLAGAVLEVFEGKDAAAIASLEKLLASAQLDDDLRFIAFKELGTLHLRSQHYDQAEASFESALRLSPPEEKEDLEDSLRFARAHAGVPPMTVTVKKLTPSRVRRDSMDMPRVRAHINGHRVDAIMDTGASDSVVSESTARRLRLQMLSFDGGIAAAGRPVTARFAMADTLLFAGHEFRHVPFIVLPDAAVNVPLGPGEVGTLEPIIGLSVLRRLGRIEVSDRDGNGKPALRAGTSTYTTSSPPNLLLPEGLPIVLAHVDSEGAELRMSLDTGSNRTALAPAALALLPALAGRATQTRVATADAAGVSSNDSGAIIPELTLHVGSADVWLSKVPVAPGPDYCEGTLGQDVFRSHGGVLIDFDRMTLEILPDRVNVTY